MRKKVQNQSSEKPKYGKQAKRNHMKSAKKIRRSKQSLRIPKRNEDRVTEMGEKVLLA